jgi:hypothetical protein
MKHRLVFLVKTHRVVCEVRTAFSYIMYINLSLQKRRTMALGVSGRQRYGGPGSIISKFM